MPYLISQEMSLNAAVTYQTFSPLLHVAMSDAECFVQDVSKEGMCAC